MIYLEKIFITKSNKAKQKIKLEKRDYIERTYLNYYSWCPRGKGKKNNSENRRALEHEGVVKKKDNNKGNKPNQGTVYVYMEVS
jgi:hypothetical protein